MTSRVLRAAAATGLLVAAVACSGAASSGPPAIQLTGDGTAVEITGLPRDTIRAVGAFGDASDKWSAVFRVAVAPEAPAMLGRYTTSGQALRFTPAYPLDPGRQYTVTFNPSAIPGLTAGGSPLVATVGRPAEHTVPSTVVTQVYPTSGTIPANTLRMYVEFSAPMGRKSGIEYVKLLDAQGREVEGAVLPLEYEFWSPDHTRFTVFFDPGRVKRGILPNRQMGRAFDAGQPATLVISREWRDANGLPLKEEYRRTFRVVDADERPLDPSQWRIAPPAAGGRAPVVVSFPKPLDHSLLLRAVGIRREGAAIAGDAQTSEGETRWSFVPDEPWRAGAYELLTLDILEDVAGNQVGRAFEVDNFDTVDKDPDPKAVTLPFTVR